MREKQSIFVIDDDEGTLCLQRAVLESEGYQVFTAASGKEALEFLAKNQKLNLILLDMRMVDMSGLEVLEFIEKKRPDIVQSVPIVFLTAMKEVPQCHTSRYICKNSGLEEFLKAVRHFIAGDSFKVAS